MSLFVIADLHLSLSCDKPMDVFRGWNNYVERLEENWRAIVREDDTVVIAGDISWAMRLEETEKDLAFLHSLPGKKLLMKGNHDYWWSTRAKIENYLAQLGYDDMEIVHNSAYKVGEIAVCGSRGWMARSFSEEDKKIVRREAGRIETSIKEAEAMGGRPIVFLHYPPVYDGVECTEILEVLQNHGITDCYFGHIHGSQAARRSITGEWNGIHMHLISADHVSFTPVLVEKTAHDTVLF